jgi:hypothetical protein
MKLLSKIITVNEGAIIVRVDLFFIRQVITVYIKLPVNPGVFFRGHNLEKLFPHSQKIKAIRKMSA